MYVPKTEEFAIDLFKRIEESGFHAVAITADANIMGKRERDIRNRFSKPPHVTFANLAKY